MMKKEYWGLAGVILLFEAVSMAIGYATRDGVVFWYPDLIRPPFVPPNIAFPVVWTILYAMIAGAGWRFFMMPLTPGRNRLLEIFTLYMFLNWSWSFIFFGAQQLFLGLVWIIAIDLVSLLLICKAWNPDRKAACLMIPPLLWTSFATYLTAGYWWLNQGLSGLFPGFF